MADLQPTYEWRGSFSDQELEELHANTFGPTRRARRWNRQLESHSLGWVTARSRNQLVGFVNVAWDGRDHAFLLDTAVAPDHQRRGIGEELVRCAADGACAAGCEWLHVDFEDRLQHFYVRRCGFRPTHAGLIEL